MVEKLLDDTKLIKVPKALAAQLKFATIRLGTSVSDYAVDALSQALRIDDMGSNLKEAVDTFQMVNVHIGAGFVNFPRHSLNRIVTLLPNKASKIINEESLEAGRWYAAYLSSKLSSDSILAFLEHDLKISWNLDEVEIVEEDVMVHFRATSFNMTEDVTNLLVLYTRGLFEELGYSVNEEDVLPGLVSFKFLKKPN